MDRREFLALGASAVASLGAFNGAAAQAASFNAWGWQQPYKRISDNSIKWLKDKGWWPLAIGNQPAFTGLPIAVGERSLCRARA